MDTAGLNQTHRLPGMRHDVPPRSTMVLGEHFMPHSDLPPERRLMVAVIRDALRCIEKYRHARDTIGRRLFEQEVEWILSNDTGWLHAFVRICDNLDLDPDAVRSMLRLEEDRTKDRQARRPVVSASALHARSPSC